MSPLNTLLLFLFFDGLCVRAGFPWGWGLVLAITGGLVVALIILEGNE